ncbi:hypothetical protein FOH10_28900 [Nocardia otitidiscaviarum]|uniref:TPR repeat domain-containing protein n=1 Tax=Nocardia otitidiscaviarum TaxID=1823 RepID=A0A516NTB5_9NOCA|nr:hypothetical protein [Nocardia otitidiscaviarum]MCP9621447.1 hypothetical protein [Nocardia otitidiscaviarum]QDP82150.1 hypothetical protein FOH10_28900 [Nocardia otitidiscaviarum]
MSPTVSQVLSWDLEALTGQATFWTQQAEGFRTQLGNATNGIKGSDTAIGGKFGTSLRDRGTTLTTNGDKIGTAITAAGTAITDNLATVSTAKQSVADQVQTIQDAGYEWRETGEVAVSDSQILAASAEVNGVKPSSEDVTTKIAALERQASDYGTELKKRLAAAGTAADTVANSITNAFKELPDAPDRRAQGQEDGATIADGRLSDEETARIGARIAALELTPEQLAAIANGEEVTVPQPTLDYLQNLYDEAGRDGLLDLADRLEKNGSPEALALREDLANGLLTLSNENVVARDENGNVTGTGGWDQLHPEIREFVGTRPNNLLEGPDGNTSDVPDDYRAGPMGWMESSRVVEYSNDVARFGSFLAASDESFIPGERFGVELDRQAAHQAWLVDNDAFEQKYGQWQINPVTGDAEWKANTEQAAQDLLSVGARNHESSYAVLTGNGSEELFGKDVPGQSYKPYEPDVIRGIFQRDWEDDGTAAGGMINWIGTESHEVGPDGQPTEQALRAREALTHLPDLFAPREEYEPSGDQPQVNRPGGLDVSEFERTEKGFADNPELSRALANVMGSNIDAYIDSAGNPRNAYLADYGEAQLEPTSANRLLYLASQSEEGRLTLEVGRQAYEASLLNAAFSQSDQSPGEYLRPHIEQLAGLDSRITNAAANALTYQDEQDISKYNDKQQEIYDRKLAAANIIGDVLVGNAGDAAKFALTEKLPGMIGRDLTDGEKFTIDTVNSNSKLLANAGVDALIKDYIDKPDKLAVQYPSESKLNDQAYRDFERAIMQSAFENGRLDQQFINPATNQPIDLDDPVNENTKKDFWRYLNRQGLTDLNTTYRLVHGMETVMGVGVDGSSLEVIRTGQQKP